MLALQLRSMRESVHEEVVAANRVAAQLLQPHGLALRGAGHAGDARLPARLGRVRSNDITLFDAQGQRAVPLAALALQGRAATRPTGSSALIAPPPSVQSIEFPGGKLVVRANASRAVLDAWDDLLRCWRRRAGAAGGRQRAGVLAGRARGAAVRPHRRGARTRCRPAASTSRCRRCPAPRRRRSARPSTAWSASCSSNIETERRAALRRDASCPTAASWRAGSSSSIEQERRLIARELHDELGQSVTAMRSMALSIAQRVQRAATPQAEQAARADRRRVVAPVRRDARHHPAPDAAGARQLRPRRGAGRPGRAHAAQPPRRARSSCRSSSADARLPRRRRAGAVPRGAGRHHQRAAPRPARSSCGCDAAQRRDGDVDAASCADDGERPAAPTGAQRSGHYGLRWLAERVEGLGGALQLAGRASRAACACRVRVPLPAAPADGSR